jgi:hypothetical protein
MSGFALLSDFAVPAGFAWRSEYEGCCFPGLGRLIVAGPMAMRSVVFDLDRLGKCNGSIWGLHKRIP